MENGILSTKTFRRGQMLHTTQRTKFGLGSKPECQGS